MIPIGLKGEYKTIITADLTVDFLGREDARVLGTPFLILLLERTARNSIKPLLPPGEDSVGTVVNIHHLAATPLGARVAFRTRVTAVDGRRISFHVEAYDAVELLAEGTHERFVIDVGRFAQSLSKKR
jgi:fluoroacetyl-CoA thioesterase